MNRASYLTYMQDLLPRGQAWVRRVSSWLTIVLDIIAGELARIHGRALDLLNEADPRTASELLPDWERNAGLPDGCSAVSTTIQERRVALHQKLTSGGGQSNAYWLSIAERLGYEIGITERRPFTCGRDQCGRDRIEGPNSTIIVGLVDDMRVRFHWSIKVLGPRVTYFLCGVSECGIDTLAKFTRAEDLECMLHRLKPAHAELVFSYEG